MCWRTPFSPAAVYSRRCCQGPYVYALYASYGFTKKEIGELFIMVTRVREGCVAQEGRTQKVDTIKGDMSC